MHHYGIVGNRLFCDGALGMYLSVKQQREAVKTQVEELLAKAGAETKNEEARAPESSQEEKEITLKEAVQDSILAMNELFPDAKHISDFVALMQKAVTLAALNTEDLDAIHELGEGWVAEETLAIAVFCALRHEHDFGRAVIAAVNHKGDSDSTGAVTGNILGAYLGYDAIPERFRRNLELRDVIVEIADDLLEGQKPEDAAWRKKYIEHDYRR